MGVPHAGEHQETANQKGSVHQSGPHITILPVCNRRKIDNDLLVAKKSSGLITFIPSYLVHLEQNSQVSHVSGLLKHFVPSDTCPFAPVETDDCCFPLLLPQTASCLNPGESSRSSGPKGRHTYFQAFPDIHAEPRSGRAAFFSIAEISFQIPCVTCEITPSTSLVSQTCSGLHSRPVRASIPQAQTGTLQPLIRSRLQILTAFCSKPLNAQRA